MFVWRLHEEEYEEEEESLPSSQEIYGSSTTAMLGGGQEELGEVSEEEGVWVEARGRQVEAVAELSDCNTTIQPPTHYTRLH